MAKDKVAKSKDDKKLKKHIKELSDKERTK